MAKEKTGIMEIIGFMSTVMISKVFYTSVMMAIKATGTAAWYTTIISGTTCLVFFLLINTYLNRFPGKDLTGAFEGTIGKIPGRAASMLFAAYFLYYAGMNLREFVEIIKAISIPYTATSIIVGSFVLVVMFIAFKGLEAMIRMSYLSFYPVIFGILIILVLAYPYYQVEYITPYGGNGILNSIITGMMRSSAYDEIIMLAFIANLLPHRKEFKKAGVASILITTAVFSSIIFCTLITFGYGIAAENTSDMYMLSRIIYFSRFFQRIDAIFLFIWVISSVVTVGAAFYFFLTIYGDCFHIHNKKPLIFPFGILLFTAALIPRDISEIIDVHMVIIKKYSFLLIFGVPVLMLLISVIFNRKGQVKNA